MHLKNKTRRMVSFTLSHAVVCLDGSMGMGGIACLCTPGEFRQRAHNPKTGDTGVRTIPRLIAASVFLPPGATSEELRDSVKNLPYVSASLRRGEMSVA